MGLENTVIDIYKRHGTAWAKLRGDRLAEGSWLSRFCDLLRPGDEVLDIGCGSGLPIARELTRRGYQITGVDSAPCMLALFQGNLPGSVAVLADMRDLSMGRRFGGLLAWDSFFHLSPQDQRSMFIRFHDHAAPGAALMFTSGPAEGIAIGDLEGDPLYHGSLGPDEYASLLDATGFQVIAHVAEDPESSRTVWLAQQRV